MKKFFVFFYLLHALPSFALEPNCSETLLEDTEPPTSSVTAQLPDQSTSILDSGSTIPLHALVTTGASSTADLRLCDGSVIRLGSNTSYRVEAVEESQGVVSWLSSLFSGSIRALVTPAETPGVVKFRLSTPSGTIGVRGTDFIVSHGSAGQSQLYTVEGDVLLGRKDQLEELKQANQAGVATHFVSVKQNTMSSVVAGGSPQAVRSFDPAKLKGLRLFAKPLEKKTRQDVAMQMKKASSLPKNRKSKELARKESPKESPTVETKETAKTSPEAAVKNKKQKNPKATKNRKQKKQISP
jgi:hypothetical protein